MSDGVNAPPATSPLAEGPAAPRLPWAGIVLWLALASLQIVIAFGARSGEETDDVPFSRVGFGVGSLAFAALAVAVAFGLAALSGLGPRDALGLSGFRARSMGQAASVALAALLIGGAVEPILRGGEQQGLAPQEWDSARAGAYVFNALVVVTAVPFAEELFYRGLGVRLLSAIAPALAIAVTGVLFSLAHGLFQAVPPLLVFAVGLAYVRYRAGSVWPCVIAHGLYNALGIGITLAL